MLLQEEILGAMEDDEENRDLPERQTEAVEVTVPVVPECTDDNSRS